MLSGRLRAPRGNREVLVRPALAHMPALVALNHEYLSRLDLTILDQPIHAIRAAARGEFAGGAGLVVQTGHQPTLYHPGVWIKNFLTNRLARRLGAAALNLIVDNDAAKHLDLRIPRMTTDGRAAVTQVPLTPTPPDPEVPYEECPAPSAGLLAEIGQSVIEACPHDGMRAGFEAFWRLARDAHRPEQTIAQLITAARHALETACGVRNREVPMSEMSACRPFRLLLLHILREAPRFLEAHNGALADYRRARRIRNRANPMPDLAADGDLVELPYWVWRAGERRGRLVARVSGETIELRRGQTVLLRAPHRSLLDAQTGPDLLAEASGRGWKIRPRALTTTMFCRLLVADAFIHGIGGAMYDLVTDEIIRRFFGIEPPPYIVCSATVRLPVTSHGVTADALRREQWLARDLIYNPDRHLAPDQARREPFQSLVRRKWDLIGRPRGDTPAERREVFVNIRRTNASILEAGLTGRLQDARQDAQRLRNHLAADAVLTGREYAFCLFPPGDLPAFYDRALAEIAP